MQTVIIDLRVTADISEDETTVAAGERFAMCLRHVEHATVAVKSAKVKGKPGRPVGWRKAVAPKDETAVMPDGVGTA